MHYAMDWDLWIRLARCSPVVMIPQLLAATVLGLLLKTFFGGEAIWALVLGAGLMGRLLANALAQLGHRVTVHEAQGPDAQGAAARVAAAMLAPLAESAITELPVVRMGQHALKRWPELIAPLPAPVFFQQNGTLVVWHRQDAAEATRFQQLLAATVRDLPQPVAKGAA